MKSWIVIAFDGFAMACIVLLLIMHVITSEVGVPMLSLLLGAGAMRRASLPTADGETPKLPPSSTLAIPLMLLASAFELFRGRHS